jgi:hypothetical protein
MYRLERTVNGGSVRQIISTSSRDEVERAHMRHLLRDIDELLHRDKHDGLIVESERHASVVRARLSSRPLVSFRILSAPIFEGDLDDSDRIDVRSLRAKIAREHVQELKKKGEAR